MPEVTVYKTNGDLVCAQMDDGPIWEFGPVTPDMYGQFPADAVAWADGDWEPDENDGQHIAATDDGLVAVAVLDITTMEIRYPAGPDNLGGAAQLWVLGEGLAS